jgi:alpha-N-acetylglucosamine transferase
MTLRASGIWSRKSYFKVLVVFVCFVFGASWHLFYASPTHVRDPDFGLLQRPERPRHAIATFLTGNSKEPESAKSAEDYYTIAARILTYQLLHANETRCSDSSIPFLVLVTSTVSNETRSQLESDGATVVPVQDIPLRWWIKTGVTRWADQFTKLRLFEMVEYDRILFIDADTLITRPIDGIFNEPNILTPYKSLLNRKNTIKSDEDNLLPGEYVFAARSDNAYTGERDHPFPPLPTTIFSAGFWLAAPSREMFSYLLSVMTHYRRFDPHTMEQSLLNYAFRREASMPWIELDYRWSATWPNSKDVDGKVASLHEKFWSTGPEDIRNKWEDVRKAMEVYYEETKA